MFGRKGSRDVRLTDRQVRELTENMSGSELRKFKREQKELKRQQKEREDDAFFDGLLWGSLLDDDD